MPDTFIKIASVTVGAGGASTIDFTSIPSTFTDLCIKMSTRVNSGVPDIRVRFNGVNANLSDKVLYGFGSGSPGSNSSTNIRSNPNDPSMTANTFSSNEIYIPNYAASVAHSVSIDGVTENNATGNSMYLTAGLWNDGVPITQVNIALSANSFVQYSTAVLYGIKNS